MRLSATEDDLALFAVWYLPHYITTNISPKTLHGEWTSLLESDKDIILACPRSHGKSTYFSLVYVLWCMLFKKKKFILLISDTHTQSASLLGAVIAELETNRDIINDFGKVAGYMPPSASEKQKWTSHDIITTTGVRVMSLGANSKFRGIRHKEARPDLIILDDLENDEHVQSSDQREKLKNLYTKSILNLGGTNTRHIIVGTILHFDSLLMNLVENPPVNWYSKLYKAIENGKALWPGMWTLELLEKKKGEIGSLAFESEFMNNPLDPTSQILFTNSFYEDNVDLNFCDCYTYLDLSSREKELNDYCAMVTIARHRDTGTLYTIDPVRMKGKLEDILEWFFQYYNKYKHIAIGIESNSFQEWFFQLAQSEGNKRGIYPPIQAIEAIKDKVTRAKSVSVHTENGTVKFHKNFQNFNSEIIQFPKAAHDDWVDSLVGSITLAMAGSNKGGMKVGGGGLYDGMKM